MKTFKNSNPVNNTVNKFEILNTFEMHNIRGGQQPEKLKTKDIDVYDVRED
jgi:hypothetical protein